MLNIGQIIKERYRIEKLIGTGSKNSQVYLAEDLKFTGDFSRRIALKVLETAHEPFPTIVLSDFLLEAQKLASLNHPHIIGIYDFFEDKNQNGYMVMPYAEGGSLATHLQNSRLSFEEAKTLFSQILAGVTYIHSQNVVHGDLKPENMLFIEGRLVISNFTLAKTLLLAKPITANNAVGNLLYASPEKINGRIVKATDSYALGMILYELVAGEPAFLADSNILAAHQHGKLPTLNSYVPSGVQPFIEHLTAKTFTKRPLSDNLNQLWQQALAGNYTGIIALPSYRPLIVKNPLPITALARPLDWPALASNDAPEPSARPTNWPAPGLVSTKKAKAHRAKHLGGVAATFIGVLVLMSYMQSIATYAQRSGPLGSPDKTTSSAVWSPDHKTVALFYSNGVIRLSNEAEDRSTTLVSHSKPILEAQWSPDGQFLASRSQDGAIRIWRENGEYIYVTFRPELRLDSLIWSTDGKKLLGMRGSQQIKLWQFGKF